MKYTSALSSLKSLLLSLLATIFIVTSVNGQSLIHLSDATGISISASEEAELQKAADSLIAAFPVAFQDSFKVYDCGFYLQQAHYQGGYLDVFGKLVEEAGAQSKYYLVVGRGIDEGGGWKFYCKLKLPQTGDLDCLGKENYKLIEFKFVESISNNQNGLFEMQYYVKAMNELGAYLIDKAECCKNRESCGNCLDYSEVKKLLKFEGFQSFSFKNVVVSPIELVQDDFKQYASIQVTDDEGVHNLNQELLDFMGELKDVFEDLSLTIEMYNGQGNCSRTITNISEKNYDGTKLYLSINVEALYIDYNNKYEISIKYRSNFNSLFSPNNQGTGTHYFFNAGGGVVIDLPKVDSKVKEYYTLAGLNIKSKYLTKSTIGKAKIGSSDAISFFGSTTSLKRLIVEGITDVNVCDIFSDEAAIESIAWLKIMIESFKAGDHSHIEHVFNQRIALLRTDAEVVNFLKSSDGLISNNEDELFAFTLLHETSHFGGWKHGGDKDGVGYGGDANSLHDKRYKKYSFSEIIKETKTVPNGPQMIKDTNQRFVNK